MVTFAHSVVDFFLSNVPPLRVILIGGPLALVWVYACLAFAGYLKQSRGLRTGYTRKTFHFLIFGSVSLIHWLWGTPAVCLFGGMTSLVVFYAVWRGPGALLYEAMAREKDAPHRTYYVLIPYFATLIGGLTSNILFGNAALFGYLATGLGDAVGEPVGTRFGKHVYRAPSFGGVKATRSYEGSAAVFVVCLLAILAGIAMSPSARLTLSAIWIVPSLAFVCMLLEAVSPHGWDNAVLLIVPSCLAKLAFGGL